MGNFAWFLWCISREMWIFGRIAYLRQVRWCKRNWQASTRFEMVSCSCQRAGAKKNQILVSSVSGKVQKVNLELVGFIGYIYNLSLKNWISCVIKDTYPNTLCLVYSSYVVIKHICNYASFKQLAKTYEWMRQAKNWLNVRQKFAVCLPIQDGC